MDDKIAKEITHDEYIKMLNTVHDCGKWSNKLRDGIGGRFAFFPTVSVSKDFLQEMREAARTEGTQKHIDVLNEVFGEEAPQPKFKVGDWVRIVKEWWTVKKGDVYQITRIATPDDRNKKHPHRYYFNDGEFSSIGGDEIEPWIPEVGEWVVIDGHDEPMQVANTVNSSYTTVKDDTYYLERNKVNGYTECCKSSIKYLRPATKEEVEKAKGEGDLLFTEAGVRALCDFLGHGDYCLFHNYEKLKGKWTSDKAQWINKTITKALKDEGLW